MSADAFFIDPAAVQGDRARLSGEELHHARVVLRLGAGAEITLLDGEGTRYRARFLGGGQKDGDLALLSREVEPQPPLLLTLALALLKSDRFEGALQKACELGVAEVVPLQTARTEVHPRWEGARATRLSRIVASSCKQCGRARFLRLAPPAPLEALNPARFDRAVLLWEDEGSRSLGEALGPGPLASCLLVVGPEGGFTRQEVEGMAARGTVPARLGPRVLRADTAAAAGAAVVQYLAGDLSQGARP